MKKSFCLAIVFALVGAGIPMEALYARTLKVGAGEKYPVPSAAAKVAKDGDTVEIGSGVYSGDVAIWKQNDLTLRGIGDVELKADGNAANGKGIWVITGRNTLVENITFSGARVSDKNGSGIRQDGANLTVRGCRFYDNENGILAGRGPSNADSEVIIEDSIFERNGHPSGRAHGIYFGDLARVTVRGSVFSENQTGHHIKSRARETHIVYNLVQDGRDGRSSYLIDFPQGGKAFVIGNVLQQSRNASNNGLVSFGAEKNLHPNGVMFVVNNTFVSDHNNTVFLKNRQTDAITYVYNNIFAGRGKISVRDIEAANNLIVSSRSDSPFVSWQNGNYALVSGSKAIDQGRVVEEFGDVSLMPKLEFQQGSGTAPRPTSGPIDIGAFEYRGVNR